MYSVLVVDDEIAVCKGIEKLINWEKYNCHVAAIAQDGREALCKMEQEHFDILLSDIRMPAIDGIQLVETLTEAGFSGKIIILSAFPEFEYARKMMSFGVKYYLLKPINQNALEETLKSVTAELAQSCKKEDGCPPLQLSVGQANEMTSNLETLADSVHAGSIEAIVRYIKQNYAKDISLITIAKKFYINPVYLGRSFKSATGKKFTQYLNLLRVEKAAELLKKSDNLIYEICASVGYQDLNYFYKIFKFYQGITPTEYRRTTKE